MDTSEQPSHLSLLPISPSSIPRSKVTHSSLVCFPRRLIPLSWKASNMSDRVQDVPEAESKPVSSPRLEGTVNCEANDTIPTPCRPNKRHKQPKPLPQSQPQTHATTESPTKSPKKKKRRKGPKPSSPEKLSPVFPQPASSLQCEGVDSISQAQTAVSESRPHLAPPINLRNDNVNGFDAQTDGIQKLLSEFRFSPHVPDLRTYPRPEFPAQSPPSGWNGSSSPGNLSGIHPPSPEVSPWRVSPGPSPTSTAASPVRDEEYQAPLLLPHYASFFRPRLSFTNDLVTIRSPIPSCRSIEHATRIREALTKFHLGVLLVDERAGENKPAWLDGLKSVVEENMPGLSSLGVVSVMICIEFSQ